MYAMNSTRLKGNGQILRIRMKAHIIGGPAQSSPVKLPLSGEAERSAEENRKIMKLAFH